MVGGRYTPGGVYTLPTMGGIPRCIYPTLPTMGGIPRCILPYVHQGGYAGCILPYVHQGGYAGCICYPMYTREAMLGMLHPMVHPREACWVCYTLWYTLRDNSAHSPPCFFGREEKPLRIVLPVSLRGKRDNEARSILFLWENVG